MSPLFFLYPNPPTDPSLLPFTLVTYFSLIAATCIYAYITSLNITCLVCIMLLMCMFPGLAVWGGSSSLGKTFLPLSAVLSYLLFAVWVWPRGLSSSTLACLWL